MSELSGNKDSKIDQYLKNIEENINNKLEQTYIKSMEHFAQTQEKAAQQAATAQKESAKVIAKAVTNSTNEIESAINKAFPNLKEASKLYEVFGKDSQNIIGQQAKILDKNAQTLVKSINDYAKKITEAKERMVGVSKHGIDVEEAPFVIRGLEYDKNAVNQSTKQIITDIESSDKAISSTLKDKIAQREKLWNIYSNLYQKTSKKGYGTEEQNLQLVRDLEKRFNVAHIIKGVENEISSLLLKHKINISDFQFHFKDVNMNSLVNEIETRLNGMTQSANIKKAFAQAGKEISNQIDDLGNKARTGDTNGIENVGVNIKKTKDETTGLEDAIKNVNKELSKTGQISKSVGQQISRLNSKQISKVNNKASFALEIANAQKHGVSLDEIGLYKDSKALEYFNQLLKENVQIREAVGKIEPSLVSAYVEKDLKHIEEQTDALNKNTDAVRKNQQEKQKNTVGGQGNVEGHHSSSVNSENQIRIREQVNAVQEQKESQEQIQNTINLITEEINKYKELAAYMADMNARANDLDNAYTEYGIPGFGDYNYVSEEIKERFNKFVVDKQEGIIAHGHNEFDTKGFRQYIDQMLKDINSSDELVRARLYSFTSHLDEYYDKLTSTQKTKIQKFIAQQKPLYQDFQKNLESYATEDFDYLLEEKTANQVKTSAKTIHDALKNMIPNGFVSNEAENLKKIIEVIKGGGNVGELLNGKNVSVVNTITGEIMSLTDAVKQFQSVKNTTTSLPLTEELQARIDMIKKEQKILSAIREENDLGDYGEKDSLSDKYYNEAIDSIKTMDVSYEDMLGTMTQIRDIQKELYVLHGQMDGLPTFHDEHQKLKDIYMAKSDQKRQLEDSLPIYMQYMMDTDDGIRDNMSEDDLKIYTRDYMEYITQAKLEIGSIDDVTFANVIKSLSSIQVPVKEVKKEVDLTQKALVKLGDVYRGVRSQELEFLDHNPEGDDAIWATSQKDLYDTLYTGYKNQGKVYSAELYARNPLMFDAKGQAFNNLTYLGDGSDEASREITALYNEIQELTKAKEESFNATGAETKEYIELCKQLGVAQLRYDDLSKSRDNVYGTHWTDDFVNLARENGYDAVKIDNINDSTGHLATSYAVWSEEQVKNIQLIASGEEELLRMHKELTSTASLPLTEESSGQTQAALKLVSTYEEVRDVITQIDSTYKNLFTKTQENTWDDQTLSLMQHLGLVDEMGQKIVELNRNGEGKKGALITDNFAILIQQTQEETKGLDLLISKLKEAKQAGIPVAQILGEFSTKTDSYQIQEKLNGQVLFDQAHQYDLIQEQNKALQVQDEHIVKLIQDRIELDRIGVKIDGGTSANFLYNKDSGFGFVDTSLKKASEQAVSLRRVVRDVVTIMTGGIPWRPGMFGEKYLENTISLLAKVKSAFLEAGYSSEVFDRELVSYFSSEGVNFAMLGKVNAILDPDKVVPDEVYERLNRLSKEIWKTSNNIRYLENDLLGAKKPFLNIEDGNEKISYLMPGINNKEIASMASVYEEQFKVLPQIEGLEEKRLRTMVDNYRSRHKSYLLLEQELQAEKEKLAVMQEEYKVVHKMVTGIEPLQQTKKYDSPKITNAKFNGANIKKTVLRKNGIILDDGFDELFDDELLLDAIIAEMETEKKRKLRIANKDWLEQHPKTTSTATSTSEEAIEQTKEATQASEAHTNAMREEAKVAEEVAAKVKKAAQVDIDSIVNNEDKSTQQKIKALESKINTGNKAIATEKRTAGDWEIKIPLFEEALSLLKEQRAEEERISAEKKKQAAEQAKINALNGGYQSDNYVINQTGRAGDEKGWAYTEQFGVAQTQRVSWNYDDKMGEFVESRAPEYTNFKGLTSAFKQGYETLKQMQYQLQKLKAIHGDAYDTSALDKLIAKQKEYVMQLLAEGREYGKNKEYVAEYRQFIEDMGDITSKTKLKYQNKQNIDAAQDDRSPAYKAASDSLIKLDAFRKKLQNSNLSSADYDDLVNQTGRITELEKECNEIKSHNKSLTKQEIADIQEKVKLIENEIKGRIEANKIATQLTASSQEDAKRDYGFKIDKFIEQLKQAKFDTLELQKKAQDLKTTLTSVSDKKGMTDVIAQFKTLGYNLDYEKTKHSIETKEYEGYYEAIEKYQQAHAELNKLLGQEVKQGKSNELTVRIDEQKKKVDELEASAVRAQRAIMNMFNSGTVSRDQAANAVSMVSNVKSGNTYSDALLNAIKKDQKIAIDVQEQKRIANELNKLFTGQEFSGGIFTNAKVGKDSATLTFLEVIGDKAVETKVYINDLAAALSSLQNGTFDIRSYDADSKSRNVTQKDYSGINQNDAIQGRLDAYNQLYRTEEKYQDLQRKVTKQTATSKEVQEFNSLVKIRKYYNEILQESLNLTKDEQAYYDKIGHAEEDKLKTKYEKYKANLVRKNEARGEVDDARIQSPEVQNALASTQQIMNEIINKNQNMDGFGAIFDNAQKDVEELNAALRAGTLDIDTYTKKTQDVANGLSNVVKVIDPHKPEEAAMAMRKYAKSLGNAEIGAFNGTNNTLQVTLDKGKGVVQELTFAYNDMSGAISIVKNVTKQSETSFTSFFKSLKGRARALTQYLMTFASFYRIVAWIRQGVSVVKELDTALTNMRKVSDESVQSLKEFQKVSFDMGQSIGATAAQIQESTAGFMKLGYSLKEAAKLAEDANIYANVGDMDVSEATEHMISSIKAWSSEFNSEVEASAAIVDRYNEIGNNFAISSADIGSAMERSAAALKAGGNTLNESLGLITAGNIVQQDAETTAAALKILSLRIRGSKADLEEMGESTEGLVSSTSKLRKEIQALTGVDIMLDGNTYKSTAQIIQEIGAVWENLTDVSQAAVLEKLAGKNRASTVAGLLENYKTIEEVVQAAEGAEGSALEENQRYMESINGHIDVMQNKMQEFWYNLLDSETMKEFVDMATQLITILDNMLSGLTESSAFGGVTSVLKSILNMIEGITKALKGTSAVIAGFGIHKLKQKLRGEKGSGGRFKAT